MAKRKSLNAWAAASWMEKARPGSTFLSQEKVEASVTWVAGRNPNSVRFTEPNNDIIEIRDGAWAHRD